MFVVGPQVNSTRLYHSGSNVEFFDGNGFQSDTKAFATATTRFRIWITEFKAATNHFI